MIKNLVKKSYIGLISQFEILEMRFDIKNQINIQS